MRNTGEPWSVLSAELRACLAESVDGTSDEFCQQFFKECCKDLLLAHKQQRSAWGARIFAQLLAAHTPQFILAQLPTV